MTPPDNVVEAARRAALGSTCLKSRRGVALFKRVSERVTMGATSTGTNGPPEPFRCTGTVECRRDCAKLCLHAEQRAIMQSGLAYFGDFELVHVKISDGKVVPGGGPSCWQCSRIVVEVGLRGVWLYELPIGDLTGHDLVDVVGNWRFYTAEEFHRATLRACNLGDVE